MKQYYVYELYNPNSASPFYVGWADAGRTRHKPRETEHLTEAKRYARKLKNNEVIKNINIDKCCEILRILDYDQMYRVEYPFSSDDRDEAFAMEKQLISKWGRSCDGGLLTNVTCGGTGANGSVSKKLESNEIKALRQQAREARELIAKIEFDRYIKPMMVDPFVLWREMMGLR
jgi:hypothetical protein